MGRIPAFSLGVMTLASTCLYAQDSIVGTYSGSVGYYIGKPHKNAGITVIITSVEDGIVKGTATHYGPICGGDYPFQGIYRNDEIRVRSPVKGGRAADCRFGFVGKVEGNKIVAKMGSHDMALFK